MSQQIVESNLKKGELHIHLRGAAPVGFFETQLQGVSKKELLERIPEHHLQLFLKTPNLSLVFDSEATPAFSEIFSFNNFDDFLATYLFTAYLVRTRNDFYSLACQVVDTLISQSYDFVELTVSVPEYLLQGISLEDIIDSLNQVKQKASIPVLWILDPVRNFGSERAEELLDRILEIDSDCFGGITIGGSEHLFPPAPFRRFYQKAREAGLGLSVHAGESLGAESIWSAIRDLKVDRIGHGIRALEDPKLVDYLADNQIPLEVSITSNIQTGIVSSLEAHPFKKLLEKGIALTVNTDDPTFFSATLDIEFNNLALLGVTPDQITTLKENAIKFSFLKDLRV